MQVKTVQGNVDGDILTKQYFLRVHSEEGKELETGLIAVGANSSLVVGVERGQQLIGPWKLLKRGPPNQTIRSLPPLHSYLYTAFL
jgi:hypothetical protein